MHKLSILSLTVVFSIMPALMTGCATAKFKFTRVNQPVMLGMVNKIDDSDSERGRLKEQIDIKINMTDKGFSYVSGNSAGIELLKRLTQLSRDAASDKIVIQTIYFGSENWWFTVGLATGFGATSWTGVAGATYEDTGNHVDGRKKED